MLTRNIAPCPKEENHTPDIPINPVEFHEWAAEKAKTHKDTRCPDCGRFKIWIPLTQEDLDAREALIKKGEEARAAEIEAVLEAKANFEAEPVLDLEDSDV